MKRTPLKRKTPLRKASQKAKRIQERRMDVKWSKCIRAIRKCAMCGETNKQLHAHHLITRSRKCLRWKLENGLCLCASCHKLGAESAHRNPHVFTMRLRERYPDRWEWIRDNKATVGVRVDLDAVEAFLDSIMPKEGE